MVKKYDIRMMHGEKRYFNVIRNLPKVKLDAKHNHLVSK